MRAFCLLIEGVFQSLKTRGDMQCFLNIYSYSLARVCDVSLSTLRMIR